jgi:hypothetical protein
MPIKVSTIDLITKENIRAIVHYYNTNLPKGFEPIEFVEYKNNSVVMPSTDDIRPMYYGFRIPSSSQTNHIYSNGTYKHMRWQRKTLVSIYNFPPFSQEEEIWLFRTIGFVLGKEHVSYYRAYNEAIKHSPSFNHTVFSDLLSRSPVPESIRTGGVVASKEGNILSRVAVDTSDLSLSANAGWKYPRIRI